MISNRPYILRAFHEWIVDSGCTPILVIDVNHPRCKIPKDYAEGGEIVFNISGSAVRDLKISNEAIEFKASFSGIIHLIYAPIKAILAIYAEENNEGIFFDSEDDSDDIDTSFAPRQAIDGSSAMADNFSQAAASAEKPVAAKGKPFLKLVE